MVRRDRSRRASLPHAVDAADVGCGKYLASPSLSIFATVSRRSVRRHNAVAARAYTAVHDDGVASLLP
ncbi:MULTISPECIES: hypothetical protein [Burkholderia]|uniref:Uncharacterized protein n=1 Tax=Burkholderia savannae TaxID=1637837 RepID=A0ABR5TF99_9BURK|nr:MULTISPECIES: hypothetical protein [Burkholderia]AOJ68288.1 hypothetical protein WS78_05605 [Burkholderia savannae]AOJ80362.1 hypothetical protein WS86_06820 [Burkholderia savannae]AOK46585.1 hypothetical protein WT60_06770 [Burkholderia sp. MSMB617WGS]KVG43142.1 hypothetical protein WS77_12905 [Burkholderia sp. MSMB0265]KVG79983.1 hypothetical protein WS81_13835 [Burkholderia sp. MSMB2040]